jgi:hypothetical protein
MCLQGEGEECHVPGCALFLHRCPDHPIIPELYEVVVSKPTFTEMMQDLVERGCYPCCSYRGKGIYRAHVNGAGNQWEEGKTPDIALRKAVKAWKRSGMPMDGYASTVK